MILNIIIILLLIAVFTAQIIRDRQHTQLIVELINKIDKSTSNNLEYFNELSRVLGSVTHFSRSVYYKHYPKPPNNNNKARKN